MKIHGRAVGIFLGVVFTVTAGAPPVQAAAKKRPVVSAPADGKRVIALAPFSKVRIELPNEEWHDFGEDFQASLTTKLQNSGKFIVSDPAPPKTSASLRALATPLELVWPGTSIPAATVRVSVNAMSFVTGTRGERMFYGFDERQPPLENEFPLRKVSFEPNWFDRTFDTKGGEELGSHAGLDLGDGFKIDALFAWLSVKYARYRARLALRLDIEAPLAGRFETRLVEVRGEGFHFDVAGAYYGYSAGIRVARTDALLRALRAAVKGSAAAVERGLSDLPLTGRIDHIVELDGKIAYLLGTGHHSEVRPGVRYEVVGVPGAALEVESSNASGSIARLVAGEHSGLAAGMLIRSGATAPSPRVASILSAMGGARSELPAAVEAIELPWRDFPKPEFAAGEVPVIGFFAALLKSVVETALLPYRIWRHFQYDRSYLAAPDQREAAAPANTGPMVAIIDSGVDYNHPALHHALWLNPAPVTDAAGRVDRYGWDFVSGDSRPADDGYHGTQLASVVLAAAPGARVLAVKAFNPWGITSSSNLYSSFVYAVDQGARLILCGWATRVPSVALERGVAYARAHGAIVIAAAGDRGDDLAEVAAYPAALSAIYDNVVTVTGVDAADQLVRVRGRFANFGVNQVQLAARGQNVRVAEPRGRWAFETGTGLAAARVAGRLARISETTGGEYPDWIRALRERHSESVAALSGAVRGGLRLSEP